MSFQRVPFTVEIRVMYELDNESMMNTYHADRGIAYTQAEIQTLADLIDGGCPGVMLLAQSTYLNYLRTDVIGLNSLNDFSATASLFADNGGRANYALPRHESFVVTRRGTLSGRSARGRVFTLGISVNSLDSDEDDNSRIFVSIADALRDSVDCFRIAIDGTGIWEPVIVSRYTDGSKRAEGVTFPWLSSDYLTRKLGTQRRRLTR